MPQNLREAIGRLPVFGHLDPPTLGQLADGSRLATFATNETVVEEGDRQRALVTVVSGCVKVFKRLPTGRSLVLTLAGPGGVVSSVAECRGEPSRFAAVALAPTTCLVTPAAEALSAVERSPRLMRHLLEDVDRRIGDLTTRLVEFFDSRVDARLARVFIQLTEEAGRPLRDGFFIPLQLSRQDLADFAGTTVETCIRVMSRWRREGILLTERAGFFVARPSALVAVVAGGPDAVEDVVHRERPRRPALSL